jgi:protein-S-isoprenylcysteine O-methyltransferase Ste14
MNILFLLAIQNVDLSSNVSSDVSPICYLGSRASSPIFGAFLMQMLLIGTCLAAIGGFIRFWCIGLLDGMFTYALTVTDSHRLITYGPYAYVRHPAYTGIWLLAAGEILIHISTGMDVFIRDDISSPASRCGVLKAFALVNFAAWLVVMLYTCIGLYKRAFAEDVLMEKRFGKEWYAWRERTPYLFLPGIV